MLTGAERKALKAKAHKLDPLVQIGAKGLTDEVVAEIERALNAHELIKVRVSADDREARDAMIESVVMRTGADKVQRVGHVLTLFRRNAREPRIDLPR